MKWILSLLLLVGLNLQANPIGTSATNYTAGIYIGFVGDSQISGYTNWLTILNGGPSGDTNSDIATVLNRYSTNVLTATNYGVSGRQIVTVNLNDLPSLLIKKPKYAFIHVGVNDIAAGTTWADYSTNLNAMATRCNNSNAVMVVDSLWPWNNGTDAQVLQVRQWNDLINLWCRTNQVGTSTYCDSWRAMGQVRSSTTFADDFVSSYALGDGVHINTNGYSNFAVVVFNFLSSYANVIPPDRLARWDLAGVQGGIPARSTIYTNLTASGNAQTDENAITNAIANCPTNQTVKLSAGNWYLTNAIAAKTGITLRGAGIGSTYLVNSNSSQAIQIKGFYNYDWDVGGQLSNRVDWLGNYQQGMTNLLVQRTNWNVATTAIPLGRLVYIDQLNDTNTSAVGKDGVNAGAYTSRANGGDGRDRYQHFMTRVTGTNQGTNITIFPPVIFPNFAAGKSPIIWYEDGNPIESFGLEDMNICTTNQNSFGVNFDNAWGCWALRVKATGGRRGFSSQNITVQCTLQSCWVEGQSGSTDDYSFGLQKWAYSKVEDFIINQVDNGIVGDSMVGNVFGYGYSTNNTSPVGAMHLNFWTHGGHCSYNLIEGSSLVTVNLENGWGSGIYNTIFRSRVEGYDFGGSQNYNNNVQAITVNATNRYMSIVGSVIGTTGKNNYYQKASAGDADRETDRLYLLNIFNNFNASLGYDTVVGSTIIRHLNWISSTNLIAPTRFAFTNSVEYTDGYNAKSGELPTSLYLTAAPTNFGALTFPPIDSGSPTYSMSRTNIPAGQRFISSQSGDSIPIYYPPSPRRFGF